MPAHVHACVWWVVPTPPRAPWACPGCRNQGSCLTKPTISRCFTVPGRRVYAPEGDIPPPRRPARLRPLATQLQGGTHARPHTPHPPLPSAGRARAHAHAAFLPRPPTTAARRPCVRRCFPIGVACSVPWEATHVRVGVLSAQPCRSSSWSGMHGARATDTRDVPPRGPFAAFLAPYAGRRRNETGPLVNTKPMYPEISNQTACVSLADPAVPTPV